MARTTFWNNESFSQLVNAIKTNRAATQKLDSYASNLAVTMNANKDKKLPGIKSEAMFDWGKRTYVPPTPQSQKAIDATAGRYAAMYQQYAKDKAKETAPVSDAIEKARADQYKKAAMPKYRGIIKEMELGKSLYKNWGDKETAEQINQTMQFDENLVPNGKLYADPETNKLTTTPSPIEMYQYRGIYIPIYRNPAGNLTYPSQMQSMFDELGIQLDMTKLKEVKATADLPHLLTGEATGYDVTMPPSIDTNVKPNGKQLYLDSTTQKIVEYETQTPLFWDKSTGQMTYTENDTPVVADDKTLEYLSGTLQTALTAWGNAQALSTLGQPVDPYAVSVKPVTVQDINRQTQIEYSLTTDENGVETVYLQDNGQPTYLEETKTIGGLPASIGMMTPPNWLGNPQQKLFKDTITGKTIGLGGWAYTGMMEGADITKQVMNTRVHSLDVQSFFGAGLDAIMANFAVVGTLIYNVGATGIRAIGSLFGADAAATDAENSWKNMQDKLAIAKRNNEVFRSEWMELINVPKAEQTLDAQDKAIQAGSEYAKFVAGTLEGMDKMTDQQKFYLEKTLLKKMNDTKARLDFITEESQKPLNTATQALAQANVWLQSGQTELAIDDVAKAYENVMIALDWDGAKAYNKDKNVPLQYGAESWIVGMEGMSDQEINAFQQFVQFGTFDYRLVDDFHRSDMESWQGVNFQFMRDMAEMSVKSGQTMTIAEMYDHLIDVWIPEYLADTRETPGFIKWKETNQLRQTERRNVAYQQMEIANMYLGLASGFDEGTPEYQMYQQLAQQFTQVATNLLIDTFEYDKRAGLVNPYATWTFRLDPDAEQMSMQRIAMAELKLGRPLTRNEITEITYIDIDPALELFGEMFFDLNNIILPGLGKAAKVMKLGIAAKAMTPGTKLYKGIKWYTDTKFYKFFKAASLSTTAAKLGQRATDISAAAFKSSPATKEEFIKYIEEIAKIVKGAGETTGDVVKNLADALNNPVFKGKVPLRVQELITQLGKHIEPDEWARLADRAWEITKNSYVEQIGKKVLKENPGKTMADELIINTINDRVNKSMTSYAGKMNISKEFGSQFRTASLLKSTEKLGARDVIADSFSGWLAQQPWMSSASKHVLGGLETIQSKYMKLWVYATLSRRPAWMIYNFTDNLFRFVMSGVSGNVMSSLADVGAMMSKSGNADALFKSGLVPPQEVGANFGMQFAHFGKEGLTLEGVGLTPNFLEFASHFKLNYQYNAAGKGFFGKLWAGFQAWPQAINSLNTSIEQGFKSLMWLKIYEKNVAKLNQVAIADVFQNLSEAMAKNNIPADTAAKIQAHVQNSWVSSGGNAAKLHDLLKFERSDPKLSGYNIYVPEQLRQAEWFDEEAQRMFVYGVAEKWSEFYGDLAKRGITTVTPEHVDEFFDGVVRIFTAEQQVKLQAAWENYRIISSVDVGTDGTKYTAPKYKRKVTEDIKDVTTEARKFVLDLDDTKPMSSKQKKTLKSTLKANNIDFEDTEDGLKAGYEKLVKKMNDYDAAKPKPLTTEEIKELEKKVDDFAKPVSQTELNKVESDIHTDSSVSDLWDTRAKAEAQTKDFLEKEISTLDAYSALTKEELTSIDNAVRAIIHQTNSMSAKINKFWRNVYPGPLMGKVEGMPKTGARWVDYFNRVSFQLENRTSHIATDVMDALKSGTFKPTTDITAEEIFRMSGVDLLYNENGFIAGIRQFNPVTGEIETITHPVQINSLKKITGIETQADATKKLVKDFLVEKELPVPDADYMQQIAFKLKAQSMPTLDEMIKGDVRLDLAIQEGRLKDANVILAEKFRFPMVSENGALLDKVLVNKVRKHAGLIDVKTLDDIDPQKTYEVLNNWYKANSGLTLKEIKDNFKPEMIKAIQDLTNSPRQIAETIYDTIERMGTIIGREMNGKTAEEVWQDILLGVYKGGDLGAVDVVRASDSMMVFNTRVRSYIEKNVGKDTKPKELLDFLTRELGQERVKLLGLDSFLKGKRKLDYNGLLKHLDTAERYIVAKPTGENFAWVIEIMDHKQSSLSSITADLLGRNTPDGELTLGVKFSKQAGELDGYSKQRLLSWASENDFNFVEFLDGTVETVTPQGVILGTGSYGVTSFIKDEMGRQQAIIQAFTNANPATALEEFFHAAEAYLPRATQDVLDEWARPIAQKLMKENPDSGLSLEAWVSEVKAKGFQKTIITKLDAPTPVQEIFNKLRSTLVAIYRKWKDFFEGITIPKNVEDVYVRMLDKDYVAKQVKDVPKPKKPIQGTLFQRASDGARVMVDPFYLKSAKVVQDIMPSSTTAEQAMNILKKNLKVEEYEWLDFDSFFKGKKKVTQQELIDYINENNVNIVEVTRGYSPKWAGEEEVARLADIHATKTEELERRAFELSNEIKEAHEFPEPSLKLERYMAGSTDVVYADLDKLYPNMTIDQIRRVDEIRLEQLRADVEFSNKLPKQPRGKHQQYTLPGGTNYREFQFTMPDLKPEFLDPTHWDEPNVIAWFRAQDMTDAEGSKVLLIEEIQSRLHQAGRTQGYALSDTKIRIDEITKSIDDYQKKSSTLSSSLKGMEQAGKTGTETYKSFSDRFYEIGEKIEALIDERIKLKNAVPNAPFKNTWDDLALKRITRLASEEGYDRVAWTPGWVQADRYNLSKQVDSIAYKQNPDGNYTLYVTPKGSQTALDTIDGTQMTNIAPAKLSEFVGEDLAAKIINGEGKEAFNSSFETIKMFDTVEDLSVGGKWTGVLYDQKIPKKAQQIIKKWNSKVDDVVLGLERTDIKPYINPFKDTFEVRDELSGDLLGTFGSMADAKKALDNIKNVTVKGFDITPEMRVGTMYEGQTLFQQATKRTPNFEKWWMWDWKSNKPGILESVVSMEDGTPITVYHGMGKEFDAFDLDFMKASSKYGGLPYFTESAFEADGYVVRAGGEGRKQGFYLSIQNVWDMDVRLPWDVLSEVDEVLKSKGYRGISWQRDMYGKDAYDEWVKIIDGSGVSDPKKVINDAIKEAGYDGITFMHGSVAGTTPHRVWSIFDVKQAKGIDNVGDWSVSDVRYLFQQADKASDPNTWANEIVKALDNMFNDPTTTLPTTLSESKKFTVTITPNTFDYVYKTFGLDEAKSYVRQISESIVDAAQGNPVAHISPGKFALGFDTQKEIDNFLKALTENEKKVINLFTEEEVWSANPKFIVGIGSDTQNSLEELSTALVRNQEEAYLQWKLENAIDTPYVIDDLLHTNEAPLFPELYQGAAKKKPPKQTKDEVNEAWRAFVQSPIFDYGNEKISLKDMWLVFFENEDNLYKAGSKGFANYAAKVADQLEDAGNMEMSAVFRELSDMTKNFTNFIEHKVNPVDALFPKTVDGSPMPLWRMNEALRNYVSSKYLVASEWAKADRAMKLWRESMKTNISGSLMEDVAITPETRAVLDEIASFASGVKNEVDDIANFGGTYKNVTIDPSDAAVNKTNFIMMDYSDNSQFLESMKQIFPFISYPAKSLGYWTDLIVTHPELVTFYYKYQDFSRATAVQQGAVASNGDVLPSLKGYVPIMEGLWFNPLAPLFYRFAFPRTEGKPETDEELSAMQWVAKFFLDDAPIFGLNIGPIPQQILMQLRDPYYPKPGWAYETIRAFFPIDYIPPVWERWLVEKVRKFSGVDQATASNIFPETGDTLMPRVSWSDYLIEREMLMMAREHIEGLTTPEDKMDYAKQVVAVYANPNREEEKLWIEARNKMETDQYFRTMGGHMTGLYTKAFTPGQVDLQSIRDEINILKVAIEDQTLANLFGMSGDPEERYDEYINTKYNTLDGYFWNALMMSRYVVDPDTGEPLQGQERRDEMARQYNIDEQTNLYYQAMKTAREELNSNLSLVMVGNKDAKSEVYKGYFEQLELIKTNPAYSLANPDSFLGYKPTVRIERDLRNRFWNEILATKPSYDPEKSYEENKRIELEWQETIPEIAETALPILEISIINQINESQVYLEDRLQQYPTWIAKIKKEANADGLKQWSKDTATPLDAVWEYYQQNILQPYFDALEGKDMYQAQAAKLAFEKSYRDPLPEEVIAWIEKEYGKDQFDRTVLMQEIQGKQYMKPEDRLNLGKSDMDLSTDEIWQIQASLGPGNSPTREDYMKAFRMLGGDENDWDFFVRVGGDVDAFRDPEDYANLLRIAKLAAEKIGLTPATDTQLMEFSEAKTSQEEFRTLVEKQLGEDIWTLQNYYYGLSTEEREQFRKENPDEYFKISQYYTLKDQYAETNPVWAAYYHPDYEATVTSGGGSSSSSGGYGGYSSGGSGYSSSGSGYSATYQEYKRSPYANAFLPQGRRGARTGMELVVYGLGKGGVTKQPWWPQELLDKLHEQMVAQIQSGQVTQAGLDYLNSVAQTNPEYSKIIRDNIKAIKSIGYYNEASQKNKPVME